MPNDMQKENLIIHSDIPEPGQLVEVRRRQWVVTETNTSALSKSPGKTQHLVSLSSLDEDFSGEEIQVIWELEPGAKTIEKAGLPSVTGWDSKEKMDAFLDAVRWGASANADRNFLQSPFRSGIAIEDYQLDPLVRAIDMSRVNLLIADDVGLGKTIEAGLVIQELILRHRVRTVLVVCPSSLQIKWKTEMREKFGLEFRIVDTEFLKELRRKLGLHVNPWTSFPRLITSMDWMKSGEGFRLLKDILPSSIDYIRKFDMLVVDEAHNVAPAMALKYTIESLRTRLVRTLAPHFAHKLFLTATPHNGYQESFTALLELLDNQRFARTIMPDEKMLRQVMVRRLKNNILDTEGNPVFPKRTLKVLEVEYTQEEREVYELLKAYTESRTKMLKETKSKFAYGSEFIHILLKKRLFSSPYAFAVTLAKHREVLLHGKKKQESTVMDDKILRNAITRAEEEFANDAAYEEVQNEAVEVAGNLAPPLTNEQKEMLDRLSLWAEKSKNCVDSKASAVLVWLDEYLKTNGKWNNKRVILFTEYRATHSWLHQILATHGYGGGQLMFIHGEMTNDEREIVKAAFQAGPEDSKARILLATDAASEGIDLQNHCNYLLHIEIPWNPNVLEQRNGRIDRHGQKEKEVFIWHPASKGVLADAKNMSLDIDHGYLWRAVQKVNTIREDLGSVGDVIARQIEEAMIGQRKIFESSFAEERAAFARKFIAGEKRHKERIANLHEKLMESKNDFRMSPEHIAQTVKIALELAEKPLFTPVDFPGCPMGKVFEAPPLPGVWGKALTGLEHPHTRRKRPVTFDHEIAKGRDDIVLLHLNHKLVQMCLRLLREELWSLGDVKHLNRVTVCVVPDSELSGIAVAIWSRLVISGGDNRKLHEELTFSGGELKHNGFARIPQLGRLKTLIDTARPFDPDPSLFEILRTRFTGNVNQIEMAYMARSRERLQDLSNTLLRQKEKEIENIQTILTELENNIHKELHSDENNFGQMYFDGFSPEEMAQKRKDFNALTERLKQIPMERENEKAIIEKHYDNPVDRTFPAAVVFLVPYSQTGGKL
jgi:ERCC4-related helicase/DNA-binding MarR family transcriptional regulator